MAIITMPSMATEVLPLFAGRFGPLWNVAFTGLGVPLGGSNLPTSLQSAVGPSARSSPPTYSVHRTLEVARPSIGTTVNHAV
jgi:hypothetical protein